MTNSGATGIIIVAAGESRRIGIDKIFMTLGKKPLLAWSLDVCQKCDIIDALSLSLIKERCNRAKTSSRKRLEQGDRRLCRRTAAAGFGKRGAAKAAWL